MPMSLPTLDIDTLPPRPEPLAPNDLRDVFGGCAKSDEDCDKDSDCCNHRKTGGCSWSGTCF